MLNNLKRLVVEDLEVGGPLAWPIYDRNGIFLIKKDIVIRTESQVARRMGHGVYCRLDEMAAATSEIVDSPASSPTLPDFSPFKLLEDVTNRLTLILVEIENPEIQFSDQIMAVTAEVKIGERRAIEFFKAPLLRYKNKSIRER